MTRRDNKVKEFLDLITLDEAAKLRGVTRSAITYLITKGRIKSQTWLGRVVVNRNDVLNYKPLKGGRPTSKVKG
jgi:hypothetical protein